MHTGEDAAALWLQAHHNARELFLTQLTDAGLEGATLLRPCAVVACTSELAAAAGDDVFVCDHIYDTAWDVSACVVVPNGSSWYAILPKCTDTVLYAAVALSAAAS